MAHEAPTAIPVPTRPVRLPLRVPWIQVAVPLRRRGQAVDDTSFRTSTGVVVPRVWHRNVTIVDDQEPRRSRVGGNACGALRAPATASGVATAKTRSNHRQAGQADKDTPKSLTKTDKAYIISLAGSGRPLGPVG